VLGSMGRFIGMLLEHHGGALPFWLAPDQVAVMPITRGQAAYAAEVLDLLCGAGVRAVPYDGQETLQRRIVAAHEDRVPVIAVLGRREEAARSVGLRRRDGGQEEVPLARVPDYLRGIA